MGNYLKVQLAFAISLLFCAGEILVASAGVPEDLLVYLPFNEGHGLELKTLPETVLTANSKMELSGQRTGKAEAP